MNTDKSPELQDAISFDDFMGVELRVGTVIEAAINQKAKKPAYVLSVDFGPYGIKTSSAQITHNYQPNFQMALVHYQLLFLYRLLFLKRI